MVWGHLTLKQPDTKSSLLNPPTEHGEDIIQQQQPNLITNYVFVALEDVVAKLFMNQTGGFPIQSSWGNKHVIIFYVHDTSAILFVPIKTDHKTM